MNKCFHEICCIEDNRTADKILDNYVNKANDIVFLMKKDVNKLVSILWKEESPLSIDTSCMCNVGQGDRRTKYSCFHCKNFNLLTDLRKPILNKPFTIQCGEYLGKQLIVYPFQCTKLYLKYNDNKVTGDTFTMKTLINMAINEHFGKVNYSINLLTSFICKSNGYFLYEYFEKPNIEGVSILSIFKQIIAMLKELSLIKFLHNNTNKCLIFSDKPVSYKYNNVKIVSPVTIKIIDFTNSSIELNGVKFSRFTDSNMTGVVSMSTDIISCYKKCKTTITDIYKYDRIGYLPEQYYLSYNFYNIVVSLMKEEPFRTQCLSNEFTKHIWDVMWLDTERDSVYQNILNDQFNISDYWIKSKIVDIVWDDIKQQ